MLMQRTFVRFFHNTPCHCKKVSLKTAKGKSVSSQQWLLRQLSDPYVEKAKMMNYRCRSAFKLIEIDDRYNILKPGQLVIDCGAAPGSWSQVAVDRVNSNGGNDKRVGMVVSIDRQQFHPITGAIILGNSDFTIADTQDKIMNVLKGNKVDVVLSDMAPNATGHHEMDYENILNLCYSVFRFAAQVSMKNAALLIKMWQSPGCKTLENDLVKFYENVRIVKPVASRADSSEVFLLARNFKGLQSDEEDNKF